MDEDSAVRYWEGYAKIAFDAGKSFSATQLIGYFTDDTRSKITLYLLYTQNTNISQSFTSSTTILYATTVRTS